MGDKQLKYDTEITDEHFYKYRELPGTTYQDSYKKYLPRSFWYPNDKETITKTFDGFKYASIPGVAVGLAWVNATTLFRGSKLAMIEAFLPHYFPWALSGTLYGLSTSMSANYRNKDDPVNHFVGGAVAGGAFGLWYQSPRVGILLALAAGCGGSGIKYIVDNGYDRMGIRRQRFFNMYRRSWFTEPIPAEGSEDDQKKYYRP